MLPDNYKLLYSSEAIAKSLQGLSADVSSWVVEAQERTKQQVLVVGILHGAIFVLADLLRCLPKSVEPGFCRVASYSKEDNTQGSLEVSLDGLELRGRAVLLVDDICDTGATLEKLHQIVLEKGAAEVKSFVLLRRLLPDAVWTPSWSAIEHAGPEWFVGYGMDDKGWNRNLPDIYHALPEA